MVEKEDWRVGNVHILSVSITVPSLSPFWAALSTNELDSEILECLGRDPCMLRLPERMLFT